MNFYFLYRSPTMPHIKMHVEVFAESKDVALQVMAILNPGLRPVDNVAKNSIRAEKIVQIINNQ